MLLIPSGRDSRRLTVVCYDVANPRRAYRLRRALHAWRIDGQYSVVETWLSARERIELCVELAACLASDADRLLFALPYCGVRETLRTGGWCLEQRDGPANAALSLVVAQRAGNALLAYDVRDPERLLAVQKRVTASTVALQRSVYWRRGTWQAARTLAARSAEFAQPGADRFWLYPLASAADLWFVVGGGPSVLPVRQGGWAPRAGLERLPA